MERRRTKKAADPTDRAILAEIAWCRANRGRTGNADYERGFLKGLQQARIVAKKARQESGDA